LVEEEEEKEGLALVSTVEQVMLRGVHGLSKCTVRQTSKSLQSAINTKDDRAKLDGKAPQMEGARPSLLKGHTPSIKGNPKAHVPPNLRCKVVQSQLYQGAQQQTSPLGKVRKRVKDMPPAK